MRILRGFTVYHTVHGIADTPTAYILDDQAIPARSTVYAAPTKGIFNRWQFEPGCLSIDYCCNP